MNLNHSHSCTDLHGSSVMSQISVAMAYKITVCQELFSWRKCKEVASHSPPWSNCRWRMDKLCFSFFNVFFFQLHKLAATAGWTAAAVWCRGMSQFDCETTIFYLPLSVWIYIGTKSTEKKVQDLNEVGSVFSCKIGNLLSLLNSVYDRKKKNLPSQDVFISSSEGAWLMFGSSRDVFSFLICLFVLF